MDMNNLVTAVKRIKMTDEMRERIIQKCYDITKQDVIAPLRKKEIHLGDELHDKNTFGGR